MVRTVFFTLWMPFGMSCTYAQDIYQNSIFSLSKSIADFKMEEAPEGWTIEGNNTFMFNQAAFSNWVAGGVNTIGMVTGVDYELKLRKSIHKWDNRITLRYGIQDNDDVGMRKSDDLINLTTKYRVDLRNHWYLGSMANLRTQFSAGYEYNTQTTTANGIDYSTEIRNKTSNFFAPGYVQVGLGVDFIPSDKFELNLHPLTTKMTFILDDALQKAGTFGLTSDGQSFVFDLGMYAGARHKAKLMKNVSLDHQTAIYANYLKDPELIDFTYHAELNFTVNKYISTKLICDLLYDHDEIRELQVKETLGIGLAYNFKKQTTQSTPPPNEID